MPDSHVAPQNGDAEERLLGSLLLAGVGGPEATQRAAAAVRETGLAEDGFFYRRNGALYAAWRAVADRGEPADCVVVAAELTRRGALADVGGAIRMRELAELATAVSNAPHYARLIMDAARERRALSALTEASAAVATGRSHPDVSERLRAAVRAYEEIGSRCAPSLSYDALLALRLPEQRFVVDGLVEAGTLGYIAGLPETRKSWLAQQLAHSVATGAPFLGHEVSAPGSVVVWWQDGATASARDRLQAAARAHGYSGLPIRFRVNDGLRLPDDIGRMRADVERAGAVLVVLDSLYAFVPTFDLKDEAIASGVLAAVKGEVCDATGAAVAVVDHEPWPTESNRGQRRTYGTVFKRAQARWNISLERSNGKLYVQAGGNDVRGLARTEVVWDAEAYELRLAVAAPDSDLAERVLEAVAAEPGRPTEHYRNAVTGQKQRIKDALLALHGAGRVRCEPPPNAGRAGAARHWYPAEPAEAGASGVAPGGGATPGEPPAPAVRAAEGRPSRPTPEGGATGRGDPAGPCVPVRTLPEEAR